MDPQNDFYEVLEVPENATDSEIKSAYRRLAKKYHPDRNPKDSKIAEHFKAVGEAYEILSDVDKRKDYDQRRNFPNISLAGNGLGFGPSGKHVSFGDLAGVGEILSTIFGQKGPPYSSRYGIKPRRGKDIHYRLEVPFRTAVRGGKISIKVPTDENCAQCSGSGAHTKSKLYRCGECKGRGAITFDQRPFGRLRPCPACFGRGVSPDRKCEKCRGSGFERQDRRIEINVPKGIDSGSKLKISGKGKRGLGGGTYGNLLITFNVKKDERFERKQLDLYMTQEIQLKEAMFGTELMVETINGENLRLVIPEGTQSGTKFKLSGKGIERGERIGDQYIEIIVEVPEHLSKDERKFVKSFGSGTDELNF